MQKYKIKVERYNSVEGAYSCTFEGGYQCLVILKNAVKVGDELELNLIPYIYMEVS